MNRAPDFDRRAVTYEAHASLQRDVAAWLAEWLPARADGPALELGAGTGIFTRHLARIAGDLVATDIAPRMVAEGTAALPSARWVVADATSPPRGTGYRWIFTCSLAQWLPDPARALRAWHDASAPAARLVAGWFVRGTLEEFQTSCPEAAPFAWRDVPGWLQLLDAAGWRVRRHETRIFPMHHTDAAAMLRDIHNIGAVVPRRFGTGRLRRALREHDRRHRGPGGLVTPFVFLRVEADRP